MALAEPRRRCYESFLRITQVCSTWRRVAFGESALWDLLINASDKHIKLADTWFSQCSCSRISLAVQPKVRMSGRFDLTLHPHIVSKLVVPYSQRLKSLGLAVDKVLLKSFSCQSFQNLEELSLFLNMENDQPWGESDIQFQSPTPSLRSLHIAMPSSILNDRFLLKLPLYQLTTLKLSGYIMASNLIEVLKQCTSIETFTGGTIYDARSQPFHSKSMPIFLPNLQYLTVIFASDVGRFLHLLEMPRILSLMTNIDVSSPECHSHFRRLQTLRTVIITGTRRGYIDEDFISSISYSTKVLLGSYACQPSTLSKIGTGGLLPNVEHLEYSGRNLQLVVDMLWARLSSARKSPERVSYIRRIVITSDDEVVFFKDKLDLLRSQGIDIIVTS